MSDVFDPEAKKEWAKIGMTACLGVAVFTAPFLRRNRLLRKVHTGAGALLVGFSLWHHQLYQPQPRAQRLPSPDRSFDETSS